MRFFTNVQNDKNLILFTVYKPIAIFRPPLGYCVPSFITTITTLYFTDNQSQNNNS